MTQQNLDFEELKNQYNLLNEKLEKQRIINEELIQESMKEKLSHIEKWYQHRFRINTIAAPILSMVFMALYIHKNFGHWGYSILILGIALLQLYLDKKSYRILDIKNLPNLSMIQATENVFKHKKARSLTQKALVIPLIILIVWTILIASRYTLNIPVLAFTTFTMGIGLLLGFYQSKQNKNRLEAVLEQIKKLRE